MKPVGAGGAVLVLCCVVGMYFMMQTMAYLTVNKTYESFIEKMESRESYIEWMLCRSESGLQGECLRYANKPDAGYIVDHVVVKTGQGDLYTHEGVHVGHIKAPFTMSAYMVFPQAK